MMKRHSKHIFICCESAQQVELLKLIQKDFESKYYLVSTSYQQPVNIVYQYIKSASDVVFILDHMCLAEKKGRMYSFLQYAIKQNCKMSFIRFEGFSFPAEFPKHLNLNHSIIYEEEYAECIVNELINKNFISKPSLRYRLQRQIKPLSIFIAILFSLFLVYGFTYYIPIYNQERKMKGYYEKAEEAYSNKEYERAASLCREALLYKKADKSKVCYLLGNIYREKGETNRAYWYYKRATLENSDFVDPYFALMNFAFKDNDDEFFDMYIKYLVLAYDKLRDKRDLGKYISSEQAGKFTAVLLSIRAGNKNSNRVAIRKILKTLVELYPDNKNVLSYAGIEFLKENGFRDRMIVPSSTKGIDENKRFAIRCLEKAYTLGDRNFNIFFFICSFYQIIDADKCSYYCQEALKMDKKDDGIWGTYINTLSRHRRYQEMEAVIDSALIYSDITCNFYYTIGDAYKYYNDEKSLSYYLKAFKIAPQHLTFINAVKTQLKRLHRMTEYDYFLKLSAKAGDSDSRIELMMKRESW